MLVLTYTQWGYNVMNGSLKSKAVILDEIFLIAQVTAIHNISNYPGTSGVMIGK